MRSYKEFDITSKTWRENPLLLIETKQAMIPNMKNMSEHKVTVKSINNIFNNLKTPLNCLTRFLLRNWIIPECYEVIALREKSKSYLI